MPALPPEDRRAALVDATLPLLREHGLAVSTRQIAQAAGVAEGTIFGAFPDKAALIQAAMLRAFDPEPVLNELGTIPLGIGLRDRLVAILSILERQSALNEMLLSAVRSTAPAAHPPKEFFQHILRSQRSIVAAIAELLEPDHALLSVAPAKAASLTLAVVLAGRRAGFAGGIQLSAEEIITVLLDGLLTRSADNNQRGGDS